MEILDLGEFEAQIGLIIRDKNNPNNYALIRFEDLEKIISFVDKLSEIDTEGVEPLIYLNDEVNVLREDKVANEVSQESALKNAPQKDSDYFKVPTVLKK